MDRTLYLFPCGSGKNFDVFGVLIQDTPVHGVVFQHQLFTGYDDMQYDWNVKSIADELIGYLERNSPDIDNIVSDYSRSTLRDVLESCRTHEKSVIYESKKHFDITGFPVDYPPKSGELFSARELGLSD